MSNSTRNTIVLAIILLILSVFFIGRYTNMNKKTSALLTENAKNSHLIDSLAVVYASIDSLKAEYTLKEALMNEQSKLIIGEDSPTITYSYLLNLMANRGLSVVYDFAANDKKEENAQYNEYIISGRTKYANLINLTHQIENQRAVLTVEDLSIGSEGAALADTVSFSMVLHTHYYSGGPSAESLSFKELAAPYTAYALFMPRISDEMLPYDVDPTLLVVDEAKLIGISRGMAFFRDSQGIIRILSRGSRVAYGYLYRIDEAAGKVVFRLNKYGLEEDFTTLINDTQ